jgi:two-component system chemotaxis sensor kinase CheA
VVISVSDDGAGLDRDKIVLRAIESGLISEADADRLNDTEAFALIFKAGLTTADEVTELAGRGVGMDVVQNVIEKLKGSITLSSERGKGTQFLLMLPLTLASIQALMFRACGRLYAVPLASVVEITRATAPIFIASTIARCCVCAIRSSPWCGWTAYPPFPPNRARPTT